MNTDLTELEVERLQTLLMEKIESLDRQLPKPFTRKYTRGESDRINELGTQIGLNKRLLEKLSGGGHRPAATEPTAPVKALSIRQPWAWLIAHGYKDVENRTWPTNFRGKLLIHAGQTMTRADYEACVIFCNALDSVHIPDFPSFEALQSELGGIVGECEIIDCGEQDDNPWFVGPHGFVIRAARVLPFRKCKGALSFFTPNFQS